MTVGQVNQKLFAVTKVVLLGRKEGKLERIASLLTAQARVRNTIMHFCQLDEESAMSTHATSAAPQEAIDIANSLTALYLSYPNRTQHAAA